MKFSEIFFRHIIGIYIQTYSIQLAHVSQRFKKLHVENLLEVKSSEVLIDDGNHYRWDNVMKILADIFANYRWKNYNAIFLLPASAVRLHSIDVPFGMSEQLIQHEINFKIQKDFPGLGSNIAIDFHAQMQKNSELLRVNYAIAKQATIQSIIQFMQQQPLNLCVIELDIDALYRNFMRCAALKSTAGYCYFLNLAETCYLLVCDDTTLIAYYLLNVRDHSVAIDWSVLQRRFAALKITELYIHQSSPIFELARLSIPENLIIHKISQTQHGCATDATMLANYFTVLGAVVQERLQW